MKCSKYKMFFGMLFLVFCVSFVSSSSTYAVDDLTYVLSASNNQSTNFCGESVSPSCSGYNFLYITTNYGFNTTSSYAGMYFIYNNNTQSSSRYYLNSPSLLLNITDFDLISTNSINNTGLLPSDWSVTFILSENNPYASGITPSGSLSITENGTYDVTNYAEAVVDVPQSSGSVGDYHDDLVAINNSILICAATCLVLYFFYCIYRMIIKSTGGFR